MKRTIFFVTACAFVAAVFSAGCGGGMGGVGYGMAPKKFGKEKIVERSGPRPKWAFENTTFVKNGVFYASGFFSDAPNLSKGLEVATVLAQASLAKSIRTRLKDDLTYASEGIGIDATTLERIINTTTDEMTIRGFFQNKLHYEKKEVLGMAGTGYKYDCFALVEITAANYKAAQDEAIGRNLKGNVSEQFQEKIDERQRIFFRLGEKETPQAPIAAALPEKGSDTANSFDRATPETSFDNAKPKSSNSLDNTAPETSDGEGDGATITEKTIQ